jgi:hypothetical protein
MSDRREKREGGSGKSGSSKGGSKGSAKTGGKKAAKDDWSGVNEPDERRRIQNRLAQRKFRRLPFSFLFYSLFKYDPLVLP